MIKKILNAVQKKNWKSSKIMRNCSFYAWKKIRHKKINEKSFYKLLIMRKQKKNSIHSISPDQNLFLFIEMKIREAFFIKKPVRINVVRLSTNKIMAKIPFKLLLNSHRNPSIKFHIELSAGTNMMNC